VGGDPTIELLSDGFAQFRYARWTRHEGIIACPVQTSI
jgi:hypothetical protein